MLYLERQGFGDKFFIEPDANLITIGRDVKSDIIFHSIHVSREHCEIKKVPPNDILVIRNLTNHNPIYVNDVNLIGKNEELELTVGSIIGLGVPLNFACGNHLKNDKFVFLKLCSNESLNSKIKIAQETDYEIVCISSNSSGQSNFCSSNVDEGVKKELDNLTLIESSPVFKTSPEKLSVLNSADNDSLIREFTNESPSTVYSSTNLSSFNESTGSRRYRNVLDDDSKVLRNSLHGGYKHSSASLLSQPRSFFSHRAANQISSNSNVNERPEDHFSNDFSIKSLEKNNAKNNAHARIFQRSEVLGCGTTGLQIKVKTESDLTEQVHVKKEIISESSQERIDSIPLVTISDDDEDDIFEPKVSMEKNIKGSNFRKFLTHDKENCFQRGIVKSEPGKSCKTNDHEFSNGTKCKEYGIKVSSFYSEFNSKCSPVSEKGGTHEADVSHAGSHKAPELTEATLSDICIKANKLEDSSALANVNTKSQSFSRGFPCENICQSKEIISVSCEEQEIKLAGNIQINLQCSNNILRSRNWENPQQKREKYLSKPRANGHRGLKECIVKVCKLPHQGSAEYGKLLFEENLKCSDHFEEDQSTLSNVLKLGSNNNKRRKVAMDNNKYHRRKYRKCEEKSEKRNEMTNKVTIKGSEDCKFQKSCGGNQFSVRNDSKMIDSSRSPKNLAIKSDLTCRKRSGINESLSDVNFSGSQKLKVPQISLRNIPLSESKANDEFNDWNKGQNSLKSFEINKCVKKEAIDSLVRSPSKGVFTFRSSPSFESQEIGKDISTKDDVSENKSGVQFEFKTESRFLSKVKVKVENKVMTADGMTIKSEHSSDTNSEDDDDEIMVYSQVNEVIMISSDDEEENKSFLKTSIETLDDISFGPLPTEEIEDFSSAIGTTNCIVGECDNKTMNNANLDVLQMEEGEEHWRHVLPQDGVLGGDVVGPNVNDCDDEERNATNFQYEEYLNYVKGKISNERGNGTKLTEPLFPLSVNKTRKEKKRSEKANAKKKKSKKKELKKVHLPSTRPDGDEQRELTVVPKQLGKLHSPKRKRRKRKVNIRNKLMKSYNFSPYLCETNKNHHLQSNLVDGEKSSRKVQAAKKRISFLNASNSSSQQRCVLTSKINNQLSKVSSNGSGQQSKNSEKLDTSKNFSVISKAKSSHADDNCRKGIAKITKLNRSQKLIDVDIFRDGHHQPSTSHHPKKTFKIPKKKNNSNLVPGFNQSTLADQSTKLNDVSSSHFSVINIVEKTSQLHVSIIDKKSTSSSNHASPLDCSGKETSVEGSSSSFHHRGILRLFPKPFNKRRYNVKFPIKDEELFSIKYIPPNEGRSSCVPVSVYRKERAIRKKGAIQYSGINSSFLFIQLVCSWNYDWLKTYRDGRLSGKKCFPPPEVYPSAWRTEKETCISQLCYEMWENVFKDWEYHAPNAVWFPCEIDSNLKFDVDFIDLFKLKTFTLLTAEWSSLNRHPAVGCFVVLKIRVDTKICHAFGYVQNITKRNSNPSVSLASRCPPGASVCVMFEILFQKLNFRSLKPGSHIFISNISYIIPYLRTYESLCQLS